MESTNRITEMEALSIVGGDGIETAFGFMVGLGIAAGATANPFLLAASLAVGAGILAYELWER